MSRRTGADRLPCMSQGSRSHMRGLAEVALASVLLAALLVVRGGGELPHPELADPELAN